MRSGASDGGGHRHARRDAVTAGWRITRKDFRSVSTGGDDSRARIAQALQPKLQGKVGEVHADPKHDLCSKVFFAMWCNVLRLLQPTRSRETLTKPMQARRGACRRGVNTRYVGCRALDPISLRAIYVQ